MHGEVSVETLDVDLQGFVLSGLHAIVVNEHYTTGKGNSALGGMSGMRFHAHCHTPVMRFHCHYHSPVMLELGIGTWCICLAFL